MLKILISLPAKSDFLLLVAGRASLVVMWDPKATLSHDIITASSPLLQLELDVGSR